MYKLAAIIGGVLLVAGVALAGTLTSLDSSNSPTVGIPAAPASATVRQADRAREPEQRGREQETRGRANGPGEDLRGPCDEPEHSADPRCTGVGTAPRDDAIADDDGVAEDDDADDRGRNRGSGSSSGPSDRSGRGGGDGDRSGHGRDEGGNPGHGGEGGDD